MNERPAKKWYQYRPLWWLILMLLVLRIPTFDRPLSRHHDFNNAVILINTVSWQQAGGGTNFGFTPVMNFQGASNKVLENGYHIDNNGNHVYLSFGAGWYVLPYIFFSLLPIDPSEAGLEILNILEGLLSTVLLFRWLAKITGQKQSAFYATVLFVLLPTPLWYMGHSYVTTGIMMPILIGLLQLWQQLSMQSKITWQQYLLFFLLCILLTYFDWIGVFLPIGMVAWHFGKKRWHRSTFALAAIALLAIVASVYFIMAMFASHVGWEQVKGYWLSRFSERSFSAGQSGIASSLLDFGRFSLAGYGPLLFVLLLSKLSAPAQHSKLQWIHYAIGITVLYNLVFLNWSLEHEFAWLVMSLLLVVWLAQNKAAWLMSLAGKRAIIVSAIASIVLYFFVNQPGDTSRNGQRYDLQKNLGVAITRSIPEDAVIFANVSNAKIEEWYARRTFNQAADKATAQRIADSLQLRKAVWMQVQDVKMVELQPLAAPPK
jgi:hypothetical protein